MTDMMRLTRPCGKLKPNKVSLTKPYFKLSQALVKSIFKAMMLVLFFNLIKEMRNFFNDDDVLINGSIHNKA